MIELSRAEARRLAVRAQLLDGRRPDDLFDVIRRLTHVQHDPTAAVAPSADLVLWSRLGDGYRPEALRDALDEQRLLELGSMIYPAEDLKYHQATMGTIHAPWQEWVDANDGFRRDVLALLRSDGPLAVRDLPDTSVIPWQSSGWTNDRNVRKMVDLLVARGEVAAAGRRGPERLWDLADRIYPDDPAPPEEAERVLAERRLRSLGITRHRKGDPGEPAVIEGVPGRWLVDAGQLNGDFTGRTALLSPLDRLVFDRKRTLDIFEFEYQLEMYKPAAKRRWGYWAMPILHGDRLVGKLDATADRPAGVLRINAVHGGAEVARDEINALATWLHLTPEW